MPQVVDVREFRSSLPSMLHARELSVVPVTLEVDQVILSSLLLMPNYNINMDRQYDLAGRRLYFISSPVCGAQEYPRSYPVLRFR
jgi:DNA excision repair protein ERCC-4